MGYGDGLELVEQFFPELAVLGPIPTDAHELCGMAEELLKGLVFATDPVGAVV